MEHLHWSFMDNYKWLEIRQPNPNTGLFSIDHNEGFSIHISVVEDILVTSGYPTYDPPQSDST